MRQKWKYALVGGICFVFAIGMMLFLITFAQVQRQKGYNQAIIENGGTPNYYNDDWFFEPYDRFDIF